MRVLSNARAAHDEWNSQGRVRREVLSLRDSMLAEHVPVVTHGEDDHGVVVLACGTQRANDLADALVDCQQRLAALPIRLLSSAIWSLDGTGKSLMKGPCQTRRLVETGVLRQWHVREGVAVPWCRSGRWSRYPCRGLGRQRPPSPGARIHWCSGTVSTWALGKPPACSRAKQQTLIADRIERESAVNIGGVVGGILDPEVAVLLAL